MAPTTLIDLNTSSGYDVDIAVDLYGGVHITYYDRPNEQFRYGYLCK